MTTRCPATVRAWTADSGGSAFLDDGTVVELGPDALQDSPFRMLRVGQRIVVQLDGKHVLAVDLP